MTNICTKQLKKRHLLQVRCTRLAALLLLLGVAASGSGQSRPAPLAVYGNTSTIEFAPVLLAAQSHAEPVAIGNGGVPDLFRPDRAVLSTNAETQALRVSVDNPNLRIIMTVSEGLYRIVARRSAGITSLADLKGKRIATISITSSGYFLHRMLRTVGLDHDDVTVVPVMPLARLADAIAAGEVDAVTIWEPEIENVLTRLGSDAIEFSGKGVYRELFNLNTTAAQLADPVQRRRIVAFVRSLLAATKQLHEDPRAAWQAVARSSGHDETLVAQTWHHHRYPGQLAADLLDVMEDEEQFLARQANRAPRARAELAGLIDTSVLEEALSGHPELVVDAPEPQVVQLQAQRLRLERVSAGLRHATAVRAARRLQAALNHYREAGLWNEAARLFTRDAVAQVGDQRHQGPDAIAAFLQSQALQGTGRSRLGDGDLNTHLAMSPVVTLDPDGRTARGRWHELSMTGRFGERADWANGIYENEYVEEDGVWKIRRLAYHPSFLGPYSPGWRNADRSDTVTVVPFHYTPDRAGTPIPLQPVVIAADRAPRDAAGQRRRAAELNARLACLRSQSQIRSLQNAYGYYVDRRMWDDVADLFAPEGTFEPGLRGVYRDRASIRRALDQFGPQGLAPGVINEHTQLQPVITMSADCQSAQARVSELVMTGQNGEEAYWGLNIQENRYRRIDGKWHLQSLRSTRRLRSNYAQGWAHSALAATAAPEGFAPDAPPTSRHAAYPEFGIPALHFANPARGGKPFGDPRAASGGSLEQQLAAAERELAIVVAQDGSENVSNAYGYYIDEFLWDNTADLFATNGEKELSYIGNYIGRERIRASMVARYGRGGRRAAGMTLHQKVAPVVTAAADGQSARVRTRLFQLNSARDGDGSYISGIYENTLVRENGIWKIRRMDLEYVWNANYSTGWAQVAERAQPRVAPGAARDFEPAPDGPLRGQSAAPFPDVAPMAFHYVNPVSGRPPEELLPP